MALQAHPAARSLESGASCKRVLATFELWPRCSEAVHARGLLGGRAGNRVAARRPCRQQGGCLSPPRAGHPRSMAPGACSLDTGPGLWGNGHLVARPDGAASGFVRECPLAGTAVRVLPADTAVRVLPGCTAVRVLPSCMAVGLGPGCTAVRVGPTITAAQGHCRGAGVRGSAVAQLGSTR